MLQTMSNEKLKDYQADMERCHTKLNLGRQHQPWIRLFGRKK
jgi:hypothetical protein